VVLSATKNGNRKTHSQSEKLQHFHCKSSPYLIDKKIGIRKLDDRNQ